MLNFSGEHMVDLGVWIGQILADEFEIVTVDFENYVDLFKVVLVGLVND